MSKYTIEKHGDGYAIYLGRDWQHHGANIGHLTEVTPATINLIQDALNATLAHPDVTMADAVAAGDSVLLNEQAALLRECRAALDSLIKQKPTLAGLLCGSTTLGNLKAELHAHRPQGILGDKHE